MYLQIGGIILRTAFLHANLVLSPELSNRFDGPPSRKSPLGPTLGKLLYTFNGVVAAINPAHPGHCHQLPRDASFVLSFAHCYRF
jgi:hypothetical protein